MFEVGGYPLLFLTAYGIAQMLALGAVALMGYYTYKYSGANPLDWETNPGSFHPLLMTIGLIFCYAQGMLVFRIFRHRKKPALKLFHFFLQATAFACVLVGLKAQFNAVKSGIHAHSLHSWMGLGTVSLFACQLYCAFITFLFPGLRLRVRQFYLPIHTFFGVAIFVMAVATAMMGVTEKVLWLAEEDFEVFQPNATVLKCFALVLALLALTLVYGVANPQFKRIPLPEETQVGHEGDIKRGGSVVGDLREVKRRQIAGLAAYDMYGND